MANIKTKPAGVLPASWYSTRAIYELERRAIFAKYWLLITHELRFPAAGAYAKFTVAGYPFFIIRDQQGNLNAFLNVCRHRAFPVVLNDEGTTNILACKYHGWSYGLSGKVAKAPRFDGVDGFDKSQYGLFKVHLKVDERGFVWINLDASENVQVKWEELFTSVDTQSRLGAFNMKNYRYDHSWDMDGEYNWKTLIDNYNECYHCSVAHPGIAKVTNLETYEVKTTNGFIEHYAESKGNPADVSGNVAPTYLFPNSSITMTDHYFYLMRVVPVSATRVSMQYEVYRNVSSTDKDFEEMDKFFKQVENEDKYLCTHAQKNINAGGYVTGPLHPHREKGVLHFKSLVKRLLVEHGEKEKASGGEINPAKRSPDDADIAEEELFCKDVCSRAGGGVGCTW
ncbi:uncharacterized protein Z519_09509 [Cladophialophora bantiana CBS 173.52]|uniref:Choline monooxygenase, chloroplastic n=1 Tax=Cladophialophora bantiana (strain ATCC 10958 / CBS 173.52 / CDC B-1940 / NIH 8579) TaxID=1442370 RepID=A0A0D2HA26_CLAB1|nr:uncharacterized protein Z519_09509 [Cladophialophora bantiana CBS 173.52]KIW90078.1 hypothetical protein Z519_09509 [Cladophialophora bantiana CBS 173.52]